MSMDFVNTLAFRKMVNITSIREKSCGLNLQKYSFPPFLHTRISSLALKHFYIRKIWMFHLYNCCASMSNYGNIVSLIEGKAYRRPTQNVLCTRSRHHRGNIKTPTQQQCPYWSYSRFTIPRHCRD